MVRLLVGTYEADDARRWKTKHEVAVRRRGRGRLSSSSGFTCRGSSCGGAEAPGCPPRRQGARSGYGGIVQSCLDAWLPGCGYFGGSRRICRGMSGISRDACLGLSVMALLRRCAGFLRLRGLQPCGYGWDTGPCGGCWWVGGFDRLFSFLHTALVAAGAFFKDVTLENVWRALSHSSMLWVSRGTQKTLPSRCWRQCGGA